MLRERVIFLKGHPQQRVLQGHEFSGMGLSKGQKTNGLRVFMKMLSYHVCVMLMVFTSLVYRYSTHSNSHYNSMSL